MKTPRVATAVCALFLLGGGAPLLAQRTAEELYQAALYQEEVQGNLQRAIDQFGRILVRFPDNRAVGAKAQLHIGLCYEKLGQQEAQQAYRRVIEDFPEHAAEVAVARGRLAGIERLEAERNHAPTFRKVDIPSRPQNGVLSPSGDSLAFVSQGSLWVVPLHSDVGSDVPGEPVAIAKNTWDEASLLSWSADGKWIAVNSDNNAAIIPMSGGDDRRVVDLPPRGGHAWSHRLALSPAGDRMAYTQIPPGEEDILPENRALYVVPVDGGEVVRLVARSAMMPSISPDGDWVAYSGFKHGHDWEESGRDAADLWVVPTAGGTPRRLTSVDRVLMGPVWSPDGSYIAVQRRPLADEPTEVWIYPLNAERSAVGNPIRITLPRSSQDMIAGWTTKDELGVFMVSEVHDALYTVPADGGKAVQVSADSRYPLYPRWSADGRWILFRGMTGDPDAPVNLVRIPATGGDPEEVSVPTKRPLVPRVPGGGLSVSPDGGRMVVAAYEHPYHQEEGVDLWVIPLNEKGSPVRLTHDPSFEGYPVWTPDGEWVVFLDGWTPGLSATEDWHSALFRVPAHGGEAECLTTLADGVGEGPIAVSPDGQKIAFLSNGAIKTMPVGGGDADVLIDSIESTQDDDDGDLAWSPDGSRIAYSGSGRIWIAPGDGSGPPVELDTGLPENARLSSFSWSPHGSRIVFRGTIGGEDELWMISDFLPARR